MGRVVVGVDGSAESAAALRLAEREAAWGLGIDPGAITLTVVPGRRPARALLRIAETADLLVVGASRRRGLAVLPSGSVGRQCSRQATCQLLIADDAAVAA